MIDQPQKFTPTIEFAKKKMVEVWKKAGGIYPDPNSIRIIFNHRLRTTAGRASKDYWGKNLIELNPHMPWDENKFVETSLHEYAHHCAGLENAHNSKWKAIMISFGYSPKQYHNMASRNIQYFTLICKKCGRELVGKYTKVKAKNRVEKAYLSRCCKSRLDKKPSYGERII